MYLTIQEMKTLHHLWTLLLTVSSEISVLISIENVIFIWQKNLEDKPTGSL